MMCHCSQQICLSLWTRQEQVCLCGRDRSRFVFVDETGADRRNVLYKYGYSLRNKPAVDHALLVRGERISAIVCMSVIGILDVKTVQGTCNGDSFYDFVHTHLMPFNGTNPNSIVVLDNCSIHCIDEVKEMFKGIGVLVLFFHHIHLISTRLKRHFQKLKVNCVLTVGMI